MSQLFSYFISSPSVLVALMQHNKSLRNHLKCVCWLIIQIKIILQELCNTVRKNVNDTNFFLKSQIYTIKLVTYILYKELIEARYKNRRKMKEIMR